ncbi:MAG: flagellar brake protein [Clostridia bacterium]|nr:flagellar brake protein [Clostridia bacterium]
MIKITLLKSLADGESVELSIIRNDEVKKFKSNVYRVLSDDEALLSAPLEKGMLYPIRPGENILISFSKDNTGIYDFYADIVARKKAGALSAIIIRKTSDIQKTQRRHYFRFSFVGAFHILKETLKKEGVEDLKEKYKDNDDIIVEGEEKVYEDMDGRDISGGGFRAISKENYKSGDVVEGYVKLDNKPIAFKAEVIRSQLIEGPYPKYDIAFKFVEIDNHARAEIISFIFKKERKTRNKEK